MAGVVEPVALQPRLPHDLLEGTAESPGEERGAVTLAEHWGVLVDGVPQEKPVHFLSFPESAEHPDG